MNDEGRGLDATVSLGGAKAAEDRDPLLSANGNRYVLQRPIGRGGMGEVFAAHDASLNRTVAVKVLRRDHRPGDNAPARLIREAQALARLRHQNVVAIYDVGLLDDQLFLAMEYVEGGSLREWMTEQRRKPDEILAVFLAAGRGLVAAHDSGLVHRDFKPDNVLLGNDGAVRVADFGLARLAADLPTEAEAASLTPRSGELFHDLTRTGSLVGTPRYMAPELLRGGPADERSDQYAFAASLYEGLYRHPAFSGSTPAELIAAIEAGAHPPADREIPPAVRAAVLRGLAADPGARYPTMRELLTALEGGASRRRRVVGASVALGAVALAAVTTFWIAGRGRTSCAGSDTRLAGIWDPAVATRVTAAFGALELAHAASLGSLVRDHLDGYRARWIATRVQICRSAEQGERSSRALDLGMACLERGRAQLDELAARLARPDRAIVNVALGAAKGLPDPGVCADSGTLGLDVPPPKDAATQAAVTALGDELARIAALSGLAEADVSVRRAEEAVTAARSLAYPPALADALTGLGTARLAAEQHAQAVAPLEEALTIAFAARHDARVADILTQLVRAAAKIAPDDADRWFALGAAAIERMGNDPRRRRTLECNYVARFLDQGRTEDMLEHARACAELSERGFGAGSSEHGFALSSLGAALAKSGAYREAKQELARAVTILESSVGPDHLLFTDALVNLSVAERALGELDHAAAHGRRALELKTRMLGADDPRLGTVNKNMAVFLGEAGDPAAALPYAEAAHRFDEARLGPAHPAVATSLGNLAITNVMLGRLDRARELATRSLQIFEGIYRDPHENLVNANTLLGTIERMRGDLDASRDHLERAVALLDGAFPPGHPQRVNPLMELGHTLSARGEHGHAVEVLENAAALLGSPDVPLAWVGEARFALAKALVAARRDRRRAREQAVLARDAYRALGPRAEREAAEVDAWLRAP